MKYTIHTSVDGDDQDIVLVSGSALTMTVPGTPVVGAEAWAEVAASAEASARSYRAKYERAREALDRMEEARGCEELRGILNDYIAETEDDW